jgi:hypothetical protein
MTTNRKRERNWSKLAVTPTSGEWINIWRRHGDGTLWAEPSPPWGAPPVEPAGPPKGT